MTREKLIFDNRSSKPLYESIELAYNLYFECWDKEQPNFAASTDDFIFNIKTNKKSVTIQIYDNEQGTKIS